MRTSERYSQLKPYIVKLIDEILTRRGVTGNASGGGSGSLTAHALSGSSHTGTLADSQAPQFLKTDGTRALTGNLSVNSSITIDGVDLSAHAADSAAHHDPVTAGDGIDLSTQQVSVDVTDLLGVGLTETANDIDVDEAYGFTWTAEHTFNADLQVNANIDFVGDQDITGTSDIFLYPTDDLILGKSGNERTWRSPDYADGIPISGFSNFINGAGNRQLTINTIKTDEFRTRLFVADTVRIDIGEEYWGKSMGIVHTDFTTPGSIGGTVTVYFEDSPLITGALFENNDWILIRYLDDSTGFAFGSIWGQVSSYSDEGNDSEGRGHQSWTFTLRSGATSQTVKKGNIAVSFGSSGQGYVHLSTLQTSDGPWIQIGEWNGSDPYTPGNRTIGTQIGELAGVSDADLDPTGKGLYSDNAFLRGLLRTTTAEISDDGLDVFVPDSGTQGVYAAPYSYAFQADDTEYVYGGLYSERDTLTDPHFSVALQALDSVTYAGDTYIDIISEATGSTGLYARVGLSAESSHGTSIFQVISSDITNTLSVVTTTDNIGLYANNFTETRGDILPETDITDDLGSASKQWATIYAENIITSGGITGGTLGGNEWEYAGNMIIDANSASNTTVSIANQGAGRADLDVDRNITVGGTVDGVNIASHAASDSAHHDPVTAGDGIDLTGQQVSVDVTDFVGTGYGLTENANNIRINLDSPSGLEFDGGDGALRIQDAIAGDGLGISSKVLSVNAGNGIEITGDAVAVDLTATSGLEFSAGDLQLADSVAGNGLGISSKVLSVNVGDGLEIAADTVVVDLATTSGLTFSSGDLAIADSIAGDGLDITGKVLAVGGGFGITVNANDIEVDESATYTWTGAHDFNNTVTVTNSADFSVGSLFQTFIANDNIGINRVADAQFDLDVNGAVRAGAFVGPHAIELKEALFILRGDSPQDLGYYRPTLTAHLGQNPYETIMESHRSRASLAKRCV